MLSILLLLLTLFTTISISSSSYADKDVQCDRFKTLQAIFKTTDNVYVVFDGQLVVHQQSDETRTHHIYPVTWPSIVNQNDLFVMSSFEVNEIRGAYVDPKSRELVLITESNQARRWSVKRYTFRDKYWLLVSEMRLEDAFALLEPSIDEIDYVQTATVFKVPEASRQVYRVAIIVKTTSNRFHLLVTKLDGTQLSIVDFNQNSLIPDVLMGDGDNMLAVYGLFYVYGSTEDFFETFTEIGSLTMSVFDVRQTSSWAGCPQRWCLSGDVDAAVRGESDQVHLIRNQYVWSFDHLPSTDPISIHTPALVHKLFNGLRMSPNAAVQFENVLWFIARDTIASVYDSRKDSYDKVEYKLNGATSFHRIFPGSKDKITEITAALSYGNQVWLFHDRVFLSKYNVTNGRLKLLVLFKPITEIFHGLPSSLDAAVVHDGNAFLFKNSFYYKINVEQLFAKSSMTLLHMIPTLTIGSLYQCSDEDYQKDTNHLMSISSKQDYMIYAVNKRQPVPIDRTLVRQEIAAVYNRKLSIQSQRSKPKVLHTMPEISLLNEQTKPPKIANSFTNILLYSLIGLVGVLVMVFVIVAVIKWRKRDTQTNTDPMTSNGDVENEGEIASNPSDE